MLFELADAAYQATRLRLDPIFWGKGIPCGNGEPVLVIPGFFGMDVYYRTLRRWLARIGYDPYPSLIPVNLHIESSLAWLLERVPTIAKKTGMPVSVIGHSMGGAEAALLAVLCPRHVCKAISLGGPLTANPNSAHRVVVRIFNIVQRLCGSSREATERLLFEIGSKINSFPHDINIVSIYSNQDRIVHPEDSRLPDGVGKNYVVEGFHVGLMVNPDVYRAIALELARSKS